MLRLQIAGPHTTILSTLCGACPYSRGGCCVAPPRVALADLGRIVSLGGRDWLLEEIARGRLVRREAWLSIARVEGPFAGAPLARCTYLGESGCTIPHDRRSATCNHYVCEEALAEEGAPDAKRVLEQTVATFAAWDAELARRAERAWPGGLPFDAAFFDWLGDAFAAVTSANRAPRASGAPARGARQAIRARRR